VIRLYYLSLHCLGAQENEKQNTHLSPSLLLSTPLKQARANMAIVYSPHDKSSKYIEHNNRINSDLKGAQLKDKRIKIHTLAVNEIAIDLSLEGCCSGIDEYGLAG